MKVVTSPIVPQKKIEIARNRVAKKNEPIQTKLSTVTTERRIRKLPSSAISEPVLKKSKNRQLLRSTSTEKLSIIESNLKRKVRREKEAFQV